MKLRLSKITHTIELDEKDMHDVVKEIDASQEALKLRSRTFRDYYPCLHEIRRLLDPELNLDHPFVKREG